MVPSNEVTGEEGAREGAGTKRSKQDFSAKIVGGWGWCGRK